MPPDVAGRARQGRPVGPVLLVQALVVGAVLATANGFVAAALRGAVGVVGREHDLLVDWVVGAVVLLPVYAGLTLAVLRAVADRRAAPGWSRTFAAAGLLVFGAGVVATLQLGAEAVLDVRAQDRELASSSAHFHAAQDPALVAGGSASCDRRCVARGETVRAHVRAAGAAVPVLVATDLVLVAWLVCAAGGEVAFPRPGERRHEAPDLVAPVHRTT
ncbi:hypothetical protein [Kineosporia sp. A_224]|uniref:hypothetical protein n=1 Tax=Kineosporia sp. A_224 TaxID=1962180 RepID=UPI000B4A92EE|nr:hypothetical protein [Kineosporia sp. A_224]